jgi:nucleotide-binding universal stress UspA family protein
MVNIHKVAAAIDLSDLSPTVLDYAASLSTAWRAQLVVVHVVHDLSYFSGVYLSDVPLSELQQRLEREADERLSELCQAVLGDQVPYQMIVVTGRPVVELKRLIQEHTIDCLVIGAHSTEKPEHQLFGSTVERLTHVCRCPIFMIPPPESAYVVLPE